MPLVIFEYRLRKKRKAEVSGDTYDVALVGREPGQSPEELEVHRGVTLGPLRQFRVSMSVAKMNATSVRLQVARSSLPESSIVIPYRRLKYKPGQSPQQISFGTFNLADPMWRVTGRVIRAPGDTEPLDSTSIALRVASGIGAETPAAVNVNAQGRFRFAGRRLLLNPGKETELRMVVSRDTGEELARYYRIVDPGTVGGCRIRLGLPLLDVWREFVATHPRLASRLEVLRYEPKPAHRGDDSWYTARRFRTLGIAQVGEGWVGKAKIGPVGDPDWVWDVALDPVYDSPDGWQLPNEKNRRKHGHGRNHGIHVEACKSLSRERLPDGLVADAATVPVDSRVWMLGTHVFDDAWDFGLPNHEHNELHPLYVMQLCMGGWFHFAVAESLAVVANVREAMGLAPGDDPPAQTDGWPRASTNGAAYRQAYLRLNPPASLSALFASYQLVIDFYLAGGMEEKLQRFFADAAIRYAAHGIDFGGSMNATEAAAHRKHVRARLASPFPKLLRDDLYQRLAELYDFLHGPPSHAPSPVSGLAPTSYLRCVFAIESLWAWDGSSGVVGESNPRASLNRAGSRRPDKLRLELGRLYRDLFDSTDKPESRATLFADAVEHYRRWQVPRTSRPSEDWDRARLLAWGADATPAQLTGEMRARAASFWEALTPHARV